MTTYDRTNPEVNKRFQEAVRGHDEVRAALEFAFHHYDAYLKYCESVCEGADTYFD